MLGITPKPVLHGLFGVVAVAAGLVAVPSSAASLPGMQRVDVRLTSSDGPDSPLGGGIALIMGGTGIPTPAPRYAESANALYLQPHGFTGTTQILTTPELSSNFDQSEAEGAQILTAAIQHQIAGGQVDAANPVVVFGYSQSSALSTFTMQQLHDQGVPSEDVHFVLVGDTANPNGGMLSAFDIPPGTNATIPNLNITLGNPTPDNLYPTDVYTLEYDGFADFPRYPLNEFSFLNALAGIIFQHSSYLGLDPERIANAIPLETTGDSLVNYYMIPAESLPLLDPLRLIPMVGQPLYDLLEPDTRILVNLGYGSITDGWNEGPANVATPVGLFPTDLNWFEVAVALVNGWQDGISAASADLLNPATYQIMPLLENPALSGLIAGAYGAGVIDTPHPSSLWDLLNASMPGLSGSSAAAFDTDSLLDVATNSVALGS